MAEDFGKEEEIWGRNSLMEGRDVTVMVMLVVWTGEGVGSVADGS